MTFRPRTPHLAMLGPRVARADLRIVRPPPKTADPHYLTPEHRAWRAQVIGRANGICQHPGCGRRQDAKGWPRMFADHIVELSDGGAALDLANGQCLCGSHHALKTAEMRRRRFAPTIS